MISPRGRPKEKLLAVPLQQPLMLLFSITFEVCHRDSIEENYKLPFIPPRVDVCDSFFSPWKKMKATLSLSPFRSLSQPRPTFPKLPNFFSGGAGGRASLYTDLARTNHGTARAAPQNAIKWVGRGIGGSSTRACWALWRRRRTASRGESCSLSVRAPAIRSWRRAVTRRTDWCWTSRRCFMTAPSTASL